MREAIVARYFPWAAALLAPSLATKVDEPSAASEEPELAGRDGAFRKAVIRAYDFQCAACGLRIKIDELGITFVDAAHLIPFSASRNDHPTNGIALCKNHHWAMDNHLIAPTPEGVWRVSKKALAHRSAGERELLRLEEGAILVPAEPAYAPHPDGLKWRAARLTA